MATTQQVSAVKYMLLLKLLTILVACCTKFSRDVMSDRDQPGGT